MMVKHQLSLAGTRKSWGKEIKYCTFAPVFHRILDFKAGLDFYPGPFFLFLCELLYKIRSGELSFLKVTASHNSR